jgi:hypothetical protein
LAFAVVSEVGALGYTYAHAQPTQQTRPFLGRICAGWPVIDIRSGQALRIFLEQAWPVYHAIEKKRQLNIVFDYFVLSQLSRQPIELQLVVTFVLLENLKSTYARERGIPFKKGKFRKPDEHQKEYPFQALLEAMLLEVEMSPDLSKIVTLRNEIIHSGITQLDTNERIKIWGFAQDIVREYLLRLLGYKGECQLYLQARPVTIG